MTVPIGYATLQLVEPALALLAGVVGVGGLVFGCVLLIRETRLTVQALREESSLSMRKSDPGGAEVGGTMRTLTTAPTRRERNDDAIR